MIEMMRLALSPAAVFTVRMTTALAASALFYALHPLDPYYATARLWLSVFPLIWVLPISLSDLFGRLKRKESGIIDTHVILRSLELWITIAMLAAAVIVILAVGMPLRLYLVQIASLLPFSLAIVGRRSYWSVAPVGVSSPVRDAARE